MSSTEIKNKNKITENYEMPKDFTKNDKLRFVRMETEGIDTKRGKLVVKSIDFPDEKNVRFKAEFDNKEDIFITEKELIELIKERPIN